MWGEKMTYKFGYVSVVGKPNAGKSTLVNYIVGEKVAIVSHKKQTTRNNILGILTEDNYQVVFIDTPGIHKAMHQLDKYMMKNVRSALAGSDLILYLVDGTKVVDMEEKEHIASLKTKETPVIVVRTKIDIEKKLVEGVEADFSVSARSGDGISELVEKILTFMNSSNEKNFEFDEDMYTDKSLKFMAAETIREFVLKNLEEEIPHGVAVNIVKFDDSESLLKIEADIICERKTHKGIIIGKGGATLKKIGAQSRVELEKLVDKKVFLQTFVKVEEDWRSKPNKLTEIGYN